MRYWLMKSEPDVFGFADLAKQRGKTTHWDGVRNYQARNFMRAMRKGDEAFFYHSNCAEPAIVGIVTIAKESYPDHSAFDPSDVHFDAESKADKPRWYMVDVRLKRKLRRPITLAALRTHEGRALRELALLQRGSRLSITPVSAAHWRFILSLE